MINLKKIGIVGSEGKAWTPKQRTKAIHEIVMIFQKNAPQNEPNDFGLPFDKLILVSGGCGGATSEDDELKFNGGIDEWAEIIADVLGVSKDIKYPEVNQWKDINQEMAGGEGWGRPEIHKKGYMSRNIQVAETSDILYSIDPKGRKWSGGMWTLEYAKELGKETHRIIIE